MEDLNTEEKILNAARKVFIEKGFDGTRMQEIADTAGMNKALLHYYFRSKDKLFMKIFELAFKTFIPKMAGILDEDKEFLEKVKLFIHNYIELLDKNPYIPLFILKEMSRNPNVIKDLVFDKFQIIYHSIDKQLQNEINKGAIRNVDTKHFLINIISMCIFPFAGKPLLTKLFQTNDNEYHDLILERKEVVFDVIHKWLKI